MPREYIRFFLATLGTSLVSGCASRAVASPLGNCPFNVVATVTNPRAVNYDVYYQASDRPATILGEVSPGSTVTFHLPGEGRGRVFVRRPAGDITSENAGNPGRPLPEIRIRVHCSGT